MSNDDLISSDPTKRELFEFEKRKFDDDHALRRDSIERQARNEAFGFFKSPLMLAVIGGVISILVNSATTHYSSENTIELERQKLQADLIKKYLEPADLKIRKDNLNFLVEAGLIPRYETQVTNYLQNHPDAIPQTASASPTLVDGKSFGSSNILTSDTLMKFERLRKALVIVRARQSVRDRTHCTGVLTAANKVVTAGYCADTRRGVGAAGNQDIKVEIANGAPPISVIDLKKIGDEASFNHIAVLTLATPAEDKIPLEIDDASPVIGQKLILPFLGKTPDEFFVSRDDDCKVTDLKGENELAYRCDAEAGSGGAPIISLDTGKILGIHSIATQEARWGIRLKADTNTR